jgi:hypothetical protein
LVEAVDPGTPLEETDVVDEFLLVSLCKNLGVSIKQATNLVSQSYKFLGHVVGKGVKGEFDVIVRWYVDIQTHVKSLVKLIKKEASDGSGSVEKALSALKHGFQSKALEVV